MTTSADVSHVGLRVRDLDRAKRFYEALGFSEVKCLTVPDKMAAGLLGLTPPIGFEAAYLQNNRFILQLITFSGYPAPDEPERGMTGGGLTHLSIAVDDMAQAQAAVQAAGGISWLTRAAGSPAWCATPKVSCSNCFRPPCVRCRLPRNGVRRPTPRTGRGT